MSVTPIYGLGLWAGPQAQPWVQHDAALRLIEALVRGSVADRDLAAPPESCDDGAAYLVATDATGLWADHDGELAVAVGADASNGWLFAAVAVEGAQLWIVDEGARMAFDGSSWAPAAGAGAPVVTISGTSANLDPADVGRYQRWTSASAKTLTVQADATEPLPDNGEWNLRNAGAGDLTLVEDDGVTINPPNGGTLVVPQGGTVTLKRAAEDEFDLLGQTVAAS